MKKLIKIFATMLSVIMLISFAACKNENTKTDDKNEGVSQTNISLFKNGTSAYKIVIPSNATSREVLSSSEMVYFFKMSTGYSLEVIEDSGLVFNGESQYISVGATNLLAASGIVINSAALGESGYMVVTKNKSVFITGSEQTGSYGVIYGTYAFLNYQVGYKAYAADEFAIKKLAYVNLYNFNLQSVPSIQTRSLGYYSCITDSSYATRLMLTNRGDSAWALWGHTMMTILPPSKYLADHPTWYSTDGKYLNLANEEMIVEFAEVAKKWIMQSPNATYIAFTPPDATGFCDRDESNAAILKYGSAGGLTVVFMNKVADILDNWLAENYPERKMTYMTFMYHASEAPPVNYNEQTKQYEPFSADVIAKDNVMVELTMPGLDFSDGLYDSSNSQYLSKLLGWRACASNLSVYSYCINFWNYFINFDNFSGIEKLYRSFAENGVITVHENGPTNAEVTGFQEMRVYVQSQLLWDSSQRYDALVNEFMEQYYKDASGYIREYYDLLRAWYKVIETEMNVSSTIYFTLDKSTYWPKSLLDQFQRLFDKAYSSIEGLKTSDPELYIKLFNRIKKENLSVSFLMLNFYQAYFSTAEVKEMVNDFKYYTSFFNLTNYMEGANLDPLITGWEENL